MDQVVAESLQVAPPAVSSGVSVPAGVLQRPVVSLPLVRLVRLVEALGVSAIENKVRGNILGEAGRFVPVLAGDTKVN